MAAVHHTWAHLALFACRAAADTQLLFLFHASFPLHLSDDAAAVAVMDIPVVAVQVVLAVVAVAADVEAFHFQVRLQNEEQRGQAQVQKPSSHAGH